MKRLLLACASITTLCGVVLSTVGCGAADGPLVKATIQDGPDAGSFQGDVSGSNFRGQHAENGFKYGYADMESNLMLPTITMANLTSDNKGTSGGKFTESEYANAIEGSETKKNVGNLPAGGIPKADWKDLLEQYSTPNDTYFTDIAATPGAGETYSSLGLIPYYKDLVKQNYYWGEEGNAKYSILNALNNIVTFTKVQKALNILNNNFLNPELKTTGSTDSKNKVATQQGLQALVYIGNINYTLTYVGTKDTFTIPIIVHNLYAHLNLVDYGFGITPNKPKELTYYQGWVFYGYDYFNSNNIVTTKNNKVMIPVIPGTNFPTMYMGFHDKTPDKGANFSDFVKASLLPLNKKSPNLSKFPKQTTSKNSVNYPEFAYSITVAGITEKKN